MIHSAARSVLVPMVGGGSVPICLLPPCLSLSLPSYGCLPLSHLQSLRKATTDVRLLHLSIMVLLSYLPEAGQYSCFFLYLRQVMS